MEARNKKIGELKYAINFDFTKLRSLNCTDERITDTFVL